jgi:hypothetical protein
MCQCMKHLGYKQPLSHCIFYRRCRTEPAPTKTVTPLDDEELYQKFVHEFPVLSALDLFCNKCGHPMALTYGISNLELFYAEFFCHGAARRVYLAVESFESGARLNRDTVLSTIDMVRGGQP